jgi:SNF2 family DNA or RNA helicase
MGMRIELYPYQQEAFNFFMDRGSLLLALDTGLGKTATAIAICEDLLERRMTKCCLLVVPANLKYQWAKAIAQVTDIPRRELKIKRKHITVPEEDYCTIIDGPPEKRVRQYELAMINHPDYIIVGYDTVVAEYDQYIHALGPTIAVLDEASLIKSPSSQRSQAIKECLGYFPYRLALTATPLENIPEDVYSIMQFVDRNILGRFDLFDKSYIRRDSNGGVMGYRNLDILWEKLSTAMYRKSRVDPDVAPFMPEVVYHTWEVDTEPQMLEAYVDMARDLLVAYERSPSHPGGFSLSAHYGAGGQTNTKGGMGEVMSIHTVMEQLLDYPTMIHLSALTYDESDGESGSKYAHKLVTEGARIPTDTPKLDYVLRKVNNILHNDPSSKVILFSRYREMVHVTKQGLEDLGWECVEYHGEMTSSAKEAAIAAFLDDEDTRVFVSSHAGAYGTDLPCANWLINIDMAWSGGLGTQINGRHIRASSIFDSVNVVNVIMRGTIEERKAAVREFKDDIALAAIDGKTITGSLVKDIKSLIKHAQEVIDAWEYASNYSENGDVA